MQMIDLEHVYGHFQIPLFTGYKQTSKPILYQRDFPPELRVYLTEHSHTDHKCQRIVDSHTNRMSGEF